MSSDHTYIYCIDIWDDPGFREQLGHLLSIPDAITAFFFLLLHKKEERICGLFVLKIEMVSDLIIMSPCCFYANFGDKNWVVKYLEAGNYC